MPTLLFDGHWYTSKAALVLLHKMDVIGDPHLTPDGRVVLVFDRGGVGARTTEFLVRDAVLPPVLVPQATDGCTLDGKPLRDLMTVDSASDRPRRIELDPASLPDLERLVEFDHLPEPRKAGALKDGLHKRGDKLAVVGV